ncbi:sigma-54-dependent transcriptional regulator [Silvibacterium acidisoli]|uniref:sigma-54-dependent transcriptional regulator n=1 Tax=Acidobacteriaceae bacterium ZG23-2 TaxID=2883246 RepID=UPI00406C073E
MLLASSTETSSPDPQLSSADQRSEWGLGEMVGRSPQMVRLFAQMRATARHLRVAVIEGEAGTGKMLAARTLHGLGAAAGAPFVPCLAAALFDRNSAQPLPAVLHEASEGTLFLGHVEQLSPEQQGKLVDFLQWLDHQHARRAFSAAPRQVYCSSSVPLRRMASTPGFRTDLLHRLTAIRFVVPPLRERREDIGLLAESFVRRFSVLHNKPLRGLGPQTLQHLVPHSWPGNVRELESVMQSASLECEGQWIRPIDLPNLALAPRPALPPPPHASDDDPNLDRAILAHIQRVLARAKGNKLRAARMLGISRSTLYRLLENGEEAGR